MKNFLIIMSDQHNAKIMGCAGNTVVRTPNLDKLAEQGVRFNSTYCANPLCVPSRMTFLTGRECSDIKVWSNNCRLESCIPTFAHYLSDFGYETVLCGRMHFSGPDQNHGFEKRLLGDVSGAMNRPELEDYHLFENKIPLSSTGQRAEGIKSACGRGKSTYQQYDTDVTKRFEKYIEDRKNIGDERPFCTVVGYLSPHSPYICPEELFDEYYLKVDMDILPKSYFDQLHPAIKKWLENSRALTITYQEAKIAIAAYYGLITFIDDQIGKILSSLKNSGYYDDTIIAYVSDHGDMAGEHGMWWKSCLYDGAARVPMIWSCPGLFKENTVVESPSSLLDVGPTLLEIAGAGTNMETKGKSLKTILDKDTAPDEEVREVFSEEHGLLTGTPSRMIRKGSLKLIYYHGYDKHQLFDLENDPKEYINLYDDANYLKIREELFEEVKKNWPEQILRSSEENHKVICKGQNTEGLSEFWTRPNGVNEFKYMISP